MRNVQALAYRPGLACESLCLRMRMRMRWCLVALLLLLPSMLLPSGRTVASVSRQYPEA